MSTSGLIRFHSQLMAARQELDVVPHGLTAANYTGCFWRYCEVSMPTNPPTAEALQARFGESGRDIPKRSRRTVSWPVDEACCRQ